MKAYKLNLTVRIALTDEQAEELKDFNIFAYPLQEQLEFLKKYKAILKPEGVVNLTTDSEFMHGYTLGLLHGEGHEVLYSNHNVYKQEGSPEEVTSIQTFYESQYLEQNKAITYIRFKIK